MELMAGDMLAAVEAQDRCSQETCHGKLCLFAHYKHDHLCALQRVSKVSPQWLLVMVPAFE